jgi:hypothetical protein
MSGIDDYDDSRDDDCWQCGGEGWIADCFDDLCVNAEDGCELCMCRCDICNVRPSQPSPNPSSPSGISREDEG